MCVGYNGIIPACVLSTSFGIYTNIFMLVIFSTSFGTEFLSDEKLKIVRNNWKTCLQGVLSTCFGIHTNIFMLDVFRRNV